jgi:hypothetical protein
VRRMEAVAGSIPVPGIDDMVRGVNRGVASAGNEDYLSDAHSSEEDWKFPYHISWESDEGEDCYNAFIQIPGRQDTVHGVNRGVTSAGNEDLSDTQSFEVDNDLDEEESFRLMIESYFNGETTPPPPAAAAAAVAVREEYRDEGGGYDDGGGVSDSDNNVSDVAMAPSESMTQEKQLRQEEEEEEEEEEEVHKAVRMYFGISEI